jgi:hypothetical protein
MSGDPSAPTQATAHPYEAEMEAERLGWYEITGLVRQLTPEECVVPGYWTDPDWTVRDVMAHLGTWLAEAQIQFERIRFGTYEGHDIDIDAINAQLLAGMAGQPWQVAWVQANSARSRMIDEWWRIEEPNDEALWWVMKAASHHYGEHLPRLREWVPELIARRAAADAGDA